MTVLHGHISANTAYLVDDYPYGFRLRCKIRYWIETTKHGQRVVSQTTNPKRGDAWNKPKASTFCRFAGAMYLDEAGHVQWSGAHEYMDLRETLAWRDEFAAAIPEACRGEFEKWVALKTAFDAQKARGEVAMTCTTTTAGGSTVTREVLAPEYPEGVPA